MQVIFWRFINDDHDHDHLIIWHGQEKWRKCFCLEETFILLTFVSKISIVVCHVSIVLVNWSFGRVAVGLVNTTVKSANISQQLLANIIFISSLWVSSFYTVHYGELLPLHWSVRTSSFTVTLELKSGAVVCVTPISNGGDYLPFVKVCINSILLYPPFIPSSLSIHM